MKASACWIDSLQFVPGNCAQEFHAIANAQLARHLDHPFPQWALAAGNLQTN
jgi:hypothetical protein